MDIPLSPLDIPRETPQQVAEALAMERRGAVDEAKREGEGREVEGDESLAEGEGKDEEGEHEDNEEEKVEEM